MEVNNKSAGENNHSNNELGLSNLADPIAFFQALYESLLDAELVAELKEDGTLSNFVLVNDVACQRLGYTREELMELSPYDINPSNEQSNLRDRIINANKNLKDRINNALSSKPLFTVTEHITKEGSLIHSEGNINVFQVGNKAYAIAIFRDISERKANEQLIKEKEEQFRTVINEMQVGVLIQGPNAEILTSNPIALEYLGLTEDQLIGKTSFDPDWNVIHEDGSPFPGPTHPVPQAIATKLPVKGIVMGVYRPLKKDRVWLFVDAIPLLNVDGSIKQIVCTFIEATQRIESRRELKELNKKYHQNLVLQKSIFESPTEIIIFSLDRNYCYTFFTLLHKNTIKKIWGVAIELGMNMLEVISNPDDRAKAKLNFDRALIGACFSIEEEYGDKNLSRKFYKDFYSPIHDNEGKITGLSVYVVDISKQKNSEIALIKKETFLKEIQSIAQLGTYIWDFSTNSWEGSEILDNIYGIDASFDKSTEGWNTIIHPDWREEVYNYFIHEVVEQKQKFDKVYQIIRQNDRSIRWVHGIAKVEFNEQGEPTFLKGTLRDITDIKNTEIAIVENEKKLKKGELIAKFGYWELHLNNSLFYSSEGSREIYGTNKEKLTLDEIRSFRLPEYQEMMDKALKDLIENKTPYKIEFKIKRENDGAIRDIVSVAEHDLLTNTIFGTIQDITDRKQLEKAVEQNAEQIRILSKAIAQSTVTTVITDTKGNIVFVNPKFTELSGYTFEEAKGRNPRILNSGHTSKEEYKQMWDLLTSGKSWHGIFKNKKKDGGFYWESTVISPVKNDAGVITNYIAVKEDITEIRKNIEALKRSEARLEASQKTAKVGSWEVDLATMDVICSKELCNIYEVDFDHSAKHEHHNFIEYTHPADKTMLEEVFAASMQSKNNGIVENRIITPSGNIKHIESRWKIVLDEYQNPIKAEGTSQDITEKKLTSLEKEKIVADIIIRNQELEQFSYIVSHNLRAPVSNILGLSGLIKDNLVSADEQEEVLNGITNSVEKLDGVIRDLNSVLQVKNQLSEQNVEVQFDTILTDVKDSIGNLIHENKIDIIADFSEVTSIFSIKSYLNSIFYNLISNSIKYRQQDIPPVINIKSYKTDHTVELTFSDNGIGIDLHKKKDEIFGMYKRFHNHIEGKGIGLFMVKAQVEAIGGKIFIESEINKGTTFRIAFPLKG